MCGILYAHRKDGFPAGKSILKRYQTQKKRGQRGFGFIEIEGGKVKTVHRYEGETDFENALGKATSNTIIAHHRLPTSTPNLVEATHPIFVSNKELKYDYYVIHNGVMTNEDELKRIHEKLGYEYTTEIEEIHTIKSRKGKRKTYTKKCFNDSEALAIEVARYLDGKSDKMGFIGSAAIIVLQCEKDGTLVATHYGRNSGNPIMVENNGSLFYLKSEGDGVELPVNTLVSIDYKTQQATRKEVPIGRASAYDRDADPYFPRSNHEKRRMGFHNDEDFDWDDLPFRAVEGGKSVISPLQRRASVQNLLDYPNDGEDAQRLDLPSIDYDVADDVDYSAQFEEFAASEDYLIALWDEIKDLKQDIQNCQNFLDMYGEDWAENEDNYSPEYLEEATSTLVSKELEAAKLEQSLAGKM